MKVWLPSAPEVTAAACLVQSLQDSPEDRWESCYFSAPPWFVTLLWKSSALRLLLLLFSCPVVSDSLWPHGLQHSSLHCPSPSPSLLKLMFIELVMSSNHLILCCPLFLLPSVFPSIRVFYNELALCIRGPKYWSFSISPLNEYSWLISSSIDWFDLLAVQGTLKSLL